MAVETARPIRDANYYWREASLETPIWEGRAAIKLGIEGQPVDQQTFLNLHDGYSTKDGEKDQKLPRYMRAGRRGSFDVTVNLEKGASILEAVGDSRIVDVLTASMDAVKRELERQSWTRNPWERGNGLAMASFIHGGSRADDPHLHGHIVAMNLSPSSKGWKAVEMGKNVDWKQIGKTATDAQVKGFRQLGYRVKREGNDYQIVGVPAEVKARFSKRHEAIKEREMAYEEKKGAPLTSKAKSRLSVHGRPEKPETTSAERKQSTISQMTDSERSEVNKTYLQSRKRVRAESWALDARMAFDRRQLVERGTHELERAGRSR